MINDLGRDDVVFPLIWFVLAVGLAIVIVVFAIRGQSSPAEKQCIENNTSFICVNEDGSLTVKEK